MFTLRLIDRDSQKIWSCQGLFSLSIPNWILNLFVFCDNRHFNHMCSIFFIVTSLWSQFRNVFTCDWVKGKGAVMMHPHVIMGLLHEKFHLITFKWIYYKILLWSIYKLFYLFKQYFFDKSQPDRTIEEIHITSASSKLLDLIMLNNPNGVDASGVLDPICSDTCPIFVRRLVS